MADRRKFTKSSVKSIAEPTEEKAGGAGFITVWDAEIPGFGVQVRVNGMKTFMLRYRMNGVSRKYTIGGSRT